MGKVNKEYLVPTKIIDSDNPAIIKFAEETIENATDPIEKAVKLYYAVRDGIWYDPYSPFYRPEHYFASKVLERGRGYCVSKASLLCALGRACMIPTRIGFANVKNHLATRQLIEFMGSNLFVFHGFTEFYLEDKWVKATPAFNVELCRRHRVAPLEFNGREDSIFHAYNSDKKPFMEYVEELDSFADIPVDLIVAAWKREYGEERVNRWIDIFEKAGGHDRNFNTEEIIAD